MPVLTPSNYANLATCYNCEIPDGDQLGVVIYLLAKQYLAASPMADISPSALANAARCYNCEIPPGDQLGVAAYLLDQINAGGGGGGAGGVTVAAGPPPVDGSITTLFYKDSTSGIKYINLGTTAAPDWDVI